MSSAIAKTRHSHLHRLAAAWAVALPLVTGVAAASSADGIVSLPQDRIVAPDDGNMGASSSSSPTPMAGMAQSRPHWRRSFTPAQSVSASI